MPSTDLWQRERHVQSEDEHCHHSRIPNVFRLRMITTPPLFEPRSGSSLLPNSG